MPRLHRGQQTIRTDAARYKVLACGRRWGKTRLGATLCLASAIQGGNAWWVAPDYPVAMIGWREIRALALQLPGAEIRESELMVVYGRGMVQVKSAKNPNSLRGPKLDRVVVDECAYVEEAAWTDALRPALADRKGGAMFISTPAGRNWFWRYWMRGQEDGHEWKSWRFPTVDNPYIDPAEIEAARADMPDRIYRQEFLAEFIEDGAGLFRNVRAAATAQAQAQPIANHSYVAGLDWALTGDYTVLTVIDATTAEVVHLDRFNGIEYRAQRDRVAAVCQRFGVFPVIAEANSMGKPNNDELRRAGVRVRDFDTNNASKAELIEDLMFAFEQGKVRIPDNPVLIAELEAYESERLPGGKVRYNAPAGMHDDCVMSLALAWSPLAKRVSPSAYGWEG